MAQKIQIPRTQLVDAQIFETLQADGLEVALAACIEANHRPLYVPELADARIAETNKNSPLFKNWFMTPSVRVTGKSKGGKRIVVYGHVPNYFSDPANIRKAREAGLRNGAGIMPDSDFYALLDRKDDKTVLVVDHNRLQKSTSGVISVEEAFEHPQTIPFLGGEERAEQYLAKHKEVYGSNIGVWHCDDLDENPHGRLLFLGYGDYVGGLFGGSGGVLDYSGRFCVVGAAEPREEDVVRGAHARGAESAYRVPGTVVGPRLEELLTLAKEHVSPVGLKAYEEALRALLPQ